MFPSTPVRSPHTPLTQASQSFYTGLHASRTLCDVVDGFVWLLKQTCSNLKKREKFSQPVFSDLLCICLEHQESTFLKYLPAV